MKTEFQELLDTLDERQKTALIETMGYRFAQPISESEALEIDEHARKMGWKQGER